MVLEAAVGVLALALVRPPAGRRLQRLIGTTALLAGGVRTLYGGTLVAVGALALTGVLGEPADPSALRWHVLSRDPWFLLRGVLLPVAALHPAPARPDPLTARAAPSPGPGRTPSR